MSGRRNRKPVLIGRYGETVIREAIKKGELDWFSDVYRWCKEKGCTGAEKDYEEALYYILRNEHTI